MKSMLTNRNSISGLAAILLLALCFVQPQVRAHRVAQYQHELLKLDICDCGIASGQTLRYTWANLNDPDPQKREIEPLRIQVRLFAANGSVVAQAEAPAVGAGQFQSFDFNRDQINLPGEAGTGRLQVRLEMTMLFRRINSNDLTLKRGVFETFADAAEVIDALTGRTTVRL